MRIKTTKFLLVSLMMYFPGLPAIAAEIVVYKNPSCVCCKSWIKHLQRNGFKIKARDVPDVTPYKIRHGVAPRLASCHTAVIHGYVIEGHVPATDIKRLLKQRPKVTGLSAPGMPVGSPGMEAGNRKDRYNVILIHRDGITSVFSRH